MKRTTKIELLKLGHIAADFICFWMAAAFIEGMGSWSVFMALIASGICAVRTSVALCKLKGR